MHRKSARLAQSVEHETLNLRVVGSSPTLGDEIFFFFTLFHCQFLFHMYFFKNYTNRRVKEKKIIKNNAKTDFAF